MQGIVDDLKKLGATLVAISPQLPEHGRTMIERHKLTYDLLHDPNNAYAEKIGVKYTLPPEVKEIYEGFNLSLPSANGDDSWTLPIPYRLVVSQDGIVRAADIDPNYTSRPEPEKTVEDVRKLVSR